MDACSSVGIDSRSYFGRPATSRLLCLLVRHCAPLTHYSSLTHAAVLVSAHALPFDGLVFAT